MSAALTMVMDVGDFLYKQYYFIKSKNRKQRVCFKSWGYGI